ncbi:unnamed protein product [Brassica rapa]|uniref:Serine-threonine/tyrosine-protein kinase catalytic domain-containing protein n=2 Tax=Brassica campestris TaxID=3711 RepID=A0A8D9DJP8_BRACM|nr:unnamed protein product [Brassica rapa]
MKWLLKEKKLEMLVDPDMHVNYTEAKVEQLIQVALLCTPMQRPMMSDFVRMLEDDDGAFPELHNVDANGNAHHNLVQNANVQDNLVQNGNMPHNLVQNANVQQNFEAMLQHDENEAVQEEEDEDAEMQALIQLIEDTLSEDDEPGVNGEDMIMEHEENIAVVNGEDMIMEHEENIAVVNGEDMIMEHAVIADGVAAEIDGAAVQQENIAEVALVQNEEIQNEGVPNQDDDDDVDEAEV